MGAGGGRGCHSKRGGGRESWERALVTTVLLGAGVQGTRRGGGWAGPGWDLGSGGRAGKPLGLRLRGDHGHEEEGNGKH